MVIIKGILNWRRDRAMNCQSFGSLKERDIVVSNTVLPELVFPAF